MKFINNKTAMFFIDILVLFLHQSKPKHLRIPRQFSVYPICVASPVNRIQLISIYDSTEINGRGAVWSLFVAGVRCFM